jgi:hypothetical protein
MISNELKSISKGFKVIIRLVELYKIFKLNIILNDEST